MTPVYGPDWLGKIVVYYLLGNWRPQYNCRAFFTEYFWNVKVLKQWRHSHRDWSRDILKRGSMCNMCDTVSSLSRFCGLSGGSVQQCDILLTLEIQYDHFYRTNMTNRLYCKRDRFFFSNLKLACSFVCSSSDYFCNSFQIPDHTEFDCPLTIISCSYWKMGCETKVKTSSVWTAHLHESKKSVLKKVTPKQAHFCQR